MPSVSDALQLVATIKAWVVHASDCLARPISVPSCKPVWIDVMWLCFALGGLVAFWAVWKVVDYRLRTGLHAANQRDVNE